MDYYWKLILLVFPLFRKTFWARFNRRPVYTDNIETVHCHLDFV